MTRELLEPGQAVLREEDLAHSAARQALDEQVPPEDLRQALVDADLWPGLTLIDDRLHQWTHPNAARAGYNDHVREPSDLRRTQEPVMIRAVVTRGWVW